jgi:hypothetical protein
MKRLKATSVPLLAVLAIGGLAACGGDTGSAAQSGPSITENQNATPTIVVRHGEPVGGVQELEYSAGDRIQFKVDSDVADEIHVLLPG